VQTACRLSNSNPGRFPPASPCVTFLVPLQPQLRMLHCTTFHLHMRLRPEHARWSVLQRNFLQDEFCLALFLNCVFIRVSGELQLALLKKTGWRYSFTCKNALCISARGPAPCFWALAFQITCNLTTGSQIRTRQGRAARVVGRAEVFADAPCWRRITVLTAKKSSVSVMWALNMFVIISFCFPCNVLVEFQVFSVLLCIPL
jgi:hypothetical protein